MAMSESTDVDGGEQTHKHGGEGRVAVLEEMLDIAHQEIVDLEEQLDSLEATYESQIEVQEDRIRQLERRVDEIDERTDLLRIVETADETDGQQRSAALLQHLQRQAEREADRDRGARASVDHEGAMDALHYPDVHRTSIYHDWDRCVRWIGDEKICWTEMRNGNKRLFLDLDSVDEDVIEPVGRGGDP
ncbi:MAG: hypothetical protein ACOCY1_06175 [Halovenus sp.]